MDFNRKESYRFDDLVRIMQRLRSPGGCPWDQEQTHASIRSNLLEEAYETADAIDCQDAGMLCEELGDLLLQIVFHSQMASERGDFDIDNVADGICKKLIVRHPHVFSDIIVSNSTEVLENWEKIKQKEKHHTSAADTVRAVPAAFPALMRSQKVQKRAAKSGFDYPDVGMAMEDLQSELCELQEAMRAQDSVGAFEELGDLLFAVVNVARFLKIDAELSLTRSCEKFIARFCEVERLAQERTINMQDTSIEGLNDLWREAKSNL